jgi:hypothetical protein
MQPYRNDSQWARDRTPGNLLRLVRGAEQADLRLPSAFVRLMASLDLQDRIPSCTACYFDLDGRILSCPERPNLQLVPFLVDQQAVATWYLLLDGHAHLVVASWINLFLHGDEASDIEPAEAEAAFVESAVVCALSFDEFLHRFWFENTLWYALSEGDGNRPTPEQDAYLNFYRRGQL